MTKIFCLSKLVNRMILSAAVNSIRSYSHAIIFYGILVTSTWPFRLSNEILLFKSVGSSKITNKL